MWDEVNKVTSGKGKGNTRGFYSEMNTKRSSVLNRIRPSNLTSTNQALYCDLKTETRIC